MSCAPGTLARAGAQPRFGVLDQRNGRRACHASRLKKDTRPIAADVVTAVTIGDHQQIAFRRIEQRHRRTPPCGTTRVDRRNAERAQSTRTLAARSTAREEEFAISGPSWMSPSLE